MADELYSRFFDVVKEDNFEEFKRLLTNRDIDVNKQETVSKFIQI